MANKELVYSNDRREMTVVDADAIASTIHIETQVQVQVRTSTSTIVSFHLPQRRS